MRRWAPALLYIAAIFVASSIPGSQMPAAGLWRFDKVLHALAFAGLGALLWRATRRAPLAIALATAYGAIDELHQRYTPMRSSDPADLAADFVGACVGVALCVWVRRSR